MNRTLLIAGFAFSAAAAAAAAEPTWLTIVGDPSNAFVDTVEVDATSAVAFETMRLVKLRVNRAQPRMGFDGQPFHSYYSTAIVDCTESSAWHRSVALFGKPLWRGRMRMVEFTESDGRSLAFAEMEPNPRATGSSRPRAPSPCRACDRCPESGRRAADQARSRSVWTPTCVAQWLQQKSCSPACTPCPTIGTLHFAQRGANS